MTHRYRHLWDALFSKKWPAFGFCGGHHVIGDVFGAPLEPFGGLDARDEAFGEAADFAPGMKSEFGYLPVRLMGTHRMLDGVVDAPVFRRAHSCELKAVPDGLPLCPLPCVHPGAGYRYGLSFNPASRRARHALATSGVHG